MSTKTSLLFGICFVSYSLIAQTGPFSRFDFLIGKWSGTGSGFGNESSIIESGFHYAMDEHYIEVRNESLFEPTDEKPDGDYHLDWGFISYDKAREKIVYRQFNTEGYVNQYILIDSLSNDSALVFETENSENFIPGGKARWTIRKLAPDNIETLFDLFIPGKGYTCMGINSLHKKNKHANQSMLH